MTDDEAQSAPKAFEASKPETSAGQAVDLLEQRAAAEALRETEEKYRSLFEEMDEGFAVCELVRDAAGHAADFRYLDLNPAIMRHVGIAPEALRGRLATEVFPDRDPWYVETYALVVDSGQSVLEEHYFEHVDRWLRMNVFPRGGDRFAVLYSDITDRKRVETVLRESEQRQAFLLRFTDAIRSEPNERAVIERAVQMIAEELAVDRAYATRHYPAQDLTKVVHEVRGPGLAPLPATLRFSDFPEAGRQTFEKTLVYEDTAKDGTLTDTDKASLAAIGVGAFLSRPLRRDGSPVFALGVVSTRPRRWTSAEIALVEEATDRTWEAAERARNEAALRESEQKYAGLFAASPAPFLILRPDAPHFTIADVNGAYLTATMRTREDLVGRAMFDAFPDNPDDPAADGVSNLRAALERALVSRRFQLMDVQKYDIVRPDGPFEERWWKPANAPVVDVNGNVVAIIHHVADVTAEHRAVEALRESEEQLRLIVENARDYAIFTLDPEGIVTDWREGAEAIFGYSREEIVGRSVAILFTPEDLAAREAIKEREEAASTGRAPNIRWHVRKDGSRVFIEGVNTALRNSDDELTGFLKVGRDATERHAAEERQKVLSAELQHRVRNILAMIRSVVRRTSHSKTDVNEFVQHLEGRIDAMARTQALLTRIPGKGVDLEDVVRDEMISQAAEERKAGVYGPPVGLSPHAAELVTLAIHELATNSVKYGALGQSDGRVTVSWECLGDDGKERLELTWHETGLKNADSGAPGFGTELITQRVPYELRGTGDLKITEGTLTATIEFPLEPGFSILETQPSPWTGKRQ